MGLVHLVLQVASVVSLFLLGPRQTQRKALRTLAEYASAESKKTGNHQSTIPLLQKKLGRRTSR